MAPNEIETLKLLVTEVIPWILVAVVVTLGPWLVWAWAARLKIRVPVSGGESRIDDPGTRRVAERQVRDALGEALERLPPATQAAALECLAIATGFGYKWKVRYEAGAHFLEALGGQRMTSGSRRRNRLWKFPCGCVYELHYAQPLACHSCMQHPETLKITSADLRRFAKGCLLALLLMIASWLLAYACFAIFLV